MLKLARNVLLGLAAGALILAAMPEPAQAGRAREARAHHAAACHWKRGFYWCRGGAPRNIRPQAVRDYEAELLLRCLLDQPFVTCD